MKIQLQYLSADIDRHGNPRLYARKRGRGKIRIKAAPGTPEFLKAYEDAVAILKSGTTPRTKTAKAKDATNVPKTDTMRHLTHLYQQSADFRALDSRVQRVRGAILQSCMDEETKPGSGFRIGECPITEFGPDHVRLLRDRKKDTPAAAANRLKSLRVMFAWAAEERLMKENVARDVKSPKYKTEGFHAWTEEEVVQFQSRHPIGSKARLAMSIMLFTGMRRSDAVEVGPQHLKDGILRFKPTKTKGTTGAVLELPILPELQEVLDATPLGSKTFLETEKHTPFSISFFGGWFRDRCNEAGLPHCTAHGLRKAGAVQAAENGATEKQMMSIFGWSSSQLAAHYSKKANQKKLAAGAMHLIVPAKRG